MGLPDQLSSLAEHLVFVPAPKVDGVADTDDVDAVACKVHDVLQPPHGLAHRVTHRRWNEMGFRIHLDQVREFGMVTSILGDQSELASQDPKGAFRIGPCADFKQMPWIV